MDNNERDLELRGLDDYLAKKQKEEERDFKIARLEEDVKRLQEQVKTLSLANGLD